jgi:hypothetical protein
MGFTHFFALTCIFTHFAKHFSFGLVGLVGLGCIIINYKKAFQFLLNNNTIIVDKKN